MTGYKLKALWAFIVSQPEMIFPRYLTFALSLASASPKCRCLYGHSCWPKTAAFTALESKLSQPLLYPLPPASACYSSLSFSSTANCSEATADWTDAKWRADQPGASQNTNFETFMFLNGTIDACYINTTLGVPCGKGSVPPVGVDARSIADVQAAVTFAKQNNLRLVVKNTGHDYLGRSAGRGGFLLWTHHLKDTVYNEAFVPTGASNGTFTAITIGAGVQWFEAYDFANQNGRVIVGGISVGGSVGAAGGWISGGGHSVLAPAFGLGVDNVLQFTIVLADGSHVTANAYRHPDLFWALRGGGGGTWGVITSVTYKTYPTFPVTLSAFQVNFTTPSIAQDVVTEFVRLHPKITDLGWGGYSQTTPTTAQGLFIAPNVSVESANATFSPFFDFMANATEGTAQVYILPFPSFYTWYTAFFTNPGSSQVGNNVELASRLLPRALAESDPARAARIMLSIPGGVATNTIAGGAVSKVDPDSTGLNPSWRKALAQVYTTSIWPEGASTATILVVRAVLKKNTDILDALTTDSGSYYNEGSLYEKDFKKSYFGSHYTKLSLIKKKYDPTSLFIVASGVGSDEWDSSLQCRR